MFLAMMVDEYVVSAFAKPDNIDGIVKLPNLAVDYENAKADGFALWIVCETNRAPDGSFEVSYLAMSAPDFFANYKIDEIPEHPRDWADVSKL